MSIDWDRGTARLQLVAKWTYVAVAACGTLAYLVFSTVSALDFARSKGLDLGSPLSMAGRLAQAILAWALIWTAGYFALKYLFRGLRWIGAGFASPKP
jgi:hypothetical protein